MDPITGVALVAAVLQLVQFSIKTAKACQEIYAQGSLGDLTDIDDTATRLGDLSGSLQRSIRESEVKNPRPTLSKAEIDLIDLGQKCRICANKLHHELIKLRARPRGSRREALQKFARSIWKQSSITKLQEQLESHRRILESALLFRLHERFDIEGLKASDGFANLDRALQDIIGSITRSQTTQTTLVQQSSERTIKHISEKFARSKSSHMEERFYRDIKDSLFYPDIFSREEHIVHEFDGMEDSYQWIFEDPLHAPDETWQDSEVSRNTLRWDRFSDWLETGTTVYWINGKAGSGKSTLMHHIYKHESTVKHLKQWSGSKHLLTAAFFFWNAGARQQKTTHGLLRSLIYQMLTKCPQLIACFDKNDTLHAWTETRLLNTFGTFLTQTFVDIAVFLCIDGLDELEGEYANVVKMISSLSAQTHVKICMSSRPLWVFENAFAGMPNLRLQDLTYDSIWSYTHSRLIDMIEPRHFDSATAEVNLRHLMAKIVRRAEGVFLWVVVAVRNLREGLQNLVDLDELERDIERLPAGIENLYIQILSRIKPMYRRDAARFLQIVLYDLTFLPLDVRRMYFIDQEQVKGDVPLVFKKTQAQMLAEACGRMKTRVLSHTLGLLDVIPCQVDDNYSRIFDQESRPMNEIKIYHRTVVEFLVHNDRAKEFLKEAGLVEHICLYIARGTLTNMLYCLHANRKITPNSFFVYFDHLCMIMMEISHAERLIGTAQFHLMESFPPLSFVLEVIEDEIARQIPKLAFVSGGASVIIIDVVGMAAYFRMQHFICKVLGLPAAQLQSNPTQLSECRHSYQKNEPLVLGLEWVSAPNYGKSFSCYRQELRKCLRWHTHTQAAHPLFRQRDPETLAETYLLVCCSLSVDDEQLKRGLTLARLLLEAGADPMVQIETGFGRDPASGRPEVVWATWIRLLREYLRAKSRGDDVPVFIDSLVTLNDVFDTTKALLAQGAHVNYQIEEIRTYRTFNIDVLSGFYTYLVVCQRISAISPLEQCFGEYPEFQEFATNVERVFRRPWRRVSYFFYTKSTDGYHDKTTYWENWMRDEQRLGEYYHPNEEESELLLLLVDEYEKSKEKMAMLAEFRRIWRAHRPDIEIDDISEMKVSETEEVSEETGSSEGEVLSEKEESRHSSL